ncbi:hemolysin family protein [Paenibacillus larvae]|uniref:hemolysin family protein n=1 Tax=Paenibacillus larvae TaxID=1464 RepID=UPI0002481900|nr:hemolysin family protein [Paenibacillus larvae]AQR76452.1 hypothetical protein BXP28_02730 [Paenibacillus larvae subsp. larvae]AVF22714.1 Magnesium and cobalt efflux protein CorC [Paenibacillus larvae subsp. larvae]ETK25601.1 hypothetical protein ERIC1_4c00040 [Paenibacillus larvae subsp. larvae DSM 25719]MCY7488937.1 hemolysin family protein [Paenibacillus larvae]MCY9562335.1 hemolysin family protein [Paenibacillus larvae]
MDSDPLPHFLLNFFFVLVLVLLNGFFVAAEFAIVKIRSSRVETLIQEGNARARFAKSITQNLNAYLSACQMGITLTSLGLGWIGEPAVAKMIEPLFIRLGAPDTLIHTLSFIIGFTLITALHIIIGEQYPKTYAIRKSEHVTLWVSVPLMLFYKLMLPFIWLLNSVSNWMLKKSGIEPEGEHEEVHSEEEIRMIVQESHENGLIDQTEFTLVHNVFDFTETHAKEIMIPRTDIICLYEHRSYEENKQIAIMHLHTRYPVCNPDKDNIIGFVHIKDLLKTEMELTSITELIRPLLSVPDSMPISSLLKLMQKNKTEMALLIDEYGGTSGLVTIEDILEEIVGDIQDEFDNERPDIEKRPDGSYSIDGLVLVEDVKEELGLELEQEDYDTIGGWLYAQFEVPPKPNQKITWRNFEITVEETDHLRVSRVIFQPKVSEQKLA